jgi:hypothetical protein
MKLSELKDISWHDYDLAEKVDPPPAPGDIRALVESSGLTPAQVRCAMLLSTGASIVSAARAVKVSRPAVSEWLHHNEQFKALYWAFIEEQRAELRQTMLVLSRIAVRALYSILTAPGASPGATVRAAHLALRAARIIDTAEEPEIIETSAIVVNRQLGAAD